MSATRQQPGTKPRSAGRRGSRSAGKKAAKGGNATRSRPAARRSSSRPDARPTPKRPATSSGPTRAYAGRHLGPIPLGPLIAWQVAAAFVVIAWAYAGWTWIPAGVAVIGVGLSTLVWWNGRPLWRWLGLRRAYRLRNRRAGPALPHDPALVPLREWLPDLELASVEGKRGGSEVGVVYDGSGYVVLLGPDREDLIASADPVTIPLGALASVGEAEGVRLASAQLVVQTVPAPVPALGAYGGQLAASYQEINTTAAPAMVSWWIALRLEPSRDGTALTLDGEDADALRRALRTSIAWASKVLSSSGLPCRPLAKTEVREVLALTLGVDPHHRPTSLQARRTAETRRGWTCDGITHVAGWVRSWPKEGLPGMSRLLGAITGLPTLASTASLSVTWSPEHVLRWSGYVRVSGENPKAARAAYRQLSKLSGRSKVGLVRLDSEHLPGVFSTVPLGGV